MAKNISLLGADYQDVPAVVLPKNGGGSAMFVDADDVNNVENALAIVVNGNTAPKAITAGQYLFIKNHSTLSTGGYHATANIASGGAVSGSNVAADADGISNAINDNITSLTNRINNNYQFCGYLLSNETAGTKTYKFKATAGFPSIFAYGTNGHVFNETIQIMSTSVDKIFNGTSGDDLNPVRISNTELTIVLKGYAKVQIISCYYLTITEVT